MKQIIKYGALLFALILAASIIGGCLTAGVAVVRTIVDKTEQHAENNRNNGGNAIWHRDEEGNVIFLGIPFGNNSGEVMSGSEEFLAKEINSLDIHVGSAELIVEVWDSDVIFVEYENIPVEYEFFVDDETLVIDREDRINFVWNVSFMETPKIHVSVPASKMFDKVNVDSGSGGVKLSEIKAGKSVFNSGSGSFVVKNCELGVTTMDSGSGTVIMEDIVAKDFRADTGSGRVEVSGVLTGKCDFDSGSGSVSIVVYGKEADYNYRTDMGSGAFYINGKKVEKDYRKDSKSAPYLLTFDAGSGRVSLEFDETKSITANSATNDAQNDGSYER